MPDSNETKIALVDQRSKQNSEMLSKVDETLIQLRICAQSSQKLLEIHDKGIQELSQREVLREKKNDEQFEAIVEKMHNNELELMEKRTEDRRLFNELLSNQSKSLIEQLNKANEKFDIRLTTIEKWKWKFAGVLTVLTIALPYIFKFLVALI